MADPEEVDGLIPKSVAPNMREIVRGAKLKTLQYSTDNVIQFGLLEASQSIAKAVKKSGKAKSAKCCTAIVEIAALRMVNESRPLSNEELATIILEEAPAVAQKVCEDLKIHPAFGWKSTTSGL